MLQFVYAPPPSSYGMCNPSLVDHRTKFPLCVTASASLLYRKENKTPVTIHWNPPPAGYLKLNSDGSSLGNPGPSSYGGLIRDERGNWVCGYMGKIGNETGLVAEVWGIFKGLCLIGDGGLRKVVVETDSQAAFHLITVDVVDESHPQKAIVDFCKLLMKSFECYMIHTKREGNHCADQIAKLGGKQLQEFRFLENPPPMLIPFLLADAGGVGFERPIH